MGAPPPFNNTPLLGAQSCFFVGGFSGGDGGGAPMMLALANPVSDFALPTTVAPPPRTGLTPPRPVG